MSAVLHQQLIPQSNWTIHLSSRVILNNRLLRGAHAPIEKGSVQIRRHPQASMPLTNQQLLRAFVVLEGLQADDECEDNAGDGENAS